MTLRSILLDEPVGRVLEPVLSEASYDVLQAKDQFGEGTGGAELPSWSSEHDVVVRTNNAKAFEALHAELDHGGRRLYYAQGLPRYRSRGVRSGDRGRVSPIVIDTD